MFQHLDDKRGIADLKAGGQFDLMGSEKLIKSAAVVCVALGQEERFVQQFGVATNTTSSGTSLHLCQLLE